MDSSNFNKCLIFSSSSIQYICEIINVTCACIFHSVDAVKEQFGKNYVKEWTVDKKKI